MRLLIAILAAGTLFLILQFVLAMLSRSDNRRKTVALKRLHTAADQLAPQAPISRETTSELLKREKGTNDNALGKALGNFAPLSGLSSLLAQAKWSISPAQLILISLLTGVGATALTLTLAAPIPVVMVSGLLGAFGPTLAARMAKAKRMGAFQRQLPDALDLVARALKAGHAFNSGLRMVADEFPEPIGPEFGTTLDEINFGLGADEALRNLAERVDCTDLKFFVVSVNIQRETGGNLSEIVTNIATLVRERFKLFGKVRVLSAEGKLSAWILIALPFLAGIAIMFINPGYLNKLFEHPLGEMMLWGAGINMILGILAIKKLVVIKV